MKSFSVKALEPTALANRDFYELQSTDLVLIANVETVHVVPGDIDIQRFNDALSRALSVYPLYTGSVKRPSVIGDTWKILLENSGVPVTVVDSEAREVFPSNNVVQDPLNFVHSINTEKIAKADADEKLLRVLITRFKAVGHTAIGLSGSHAVGDAFTLLNFIRLISQYYQGLGSLDPPPAYSKYPDPPSDLIVSEIPTPPGLRSSYSPGSCPPCLGNPPGDLVRTDVRLTSSQLLELYNGVQEELYHTTGSVPRFSRSDILAALVAHAISVADPDMPPVHHINNTINHRGMGLAHPDAICNSVLWAWSEPHPDFDPRWSAKRHVLANIVQIRESLLRFNENQPAQVVKAGAQLYEIAFNERVLHFDPPPGYMTLNSTWRFNWHSAHFGFPKRVRWFHTNMHAARFVKLFPANPVLLPDGTWKDRTGDMEITLLLLPEVKARFKQAFVYNVKEFGLTGEVEFVN